MTRDADPLLEIHQYLFPERYFDVPLYEWHAGTIEDVVSMIELALKDNPDARLTPVTPTDLDRLIEAFAERLEALWADYDEKEDPPSREL